MNARKLIGSGFLFVAWLVTAAALLVHPVGAAHKGADLLAMATDHRDQLITFAALYLVSALLFIPAMVLISGQATGRGRVLLPIACMLVLVGAAGHAAESTMNMLLTVIASIPGDTVAKAKVLDNSTGAVAPVLALAVIFDLALIVLAGAAWRARLTSFWPLVFVAAGAVAGNVAPPGVVFQAVALAAITVGMAWIGLGIARSGRSAANVPTGARSVASGASPAPTA